MEWTSPERWLGFMPRVGCCLTSGTAVSGGPVASLLLRPPPMRHPCGRTRDLALARRSGRSDPHRRSEEHTSELQSRENLVCRLLLEKKNRTPTHSESLASTRP